MNTTFRNRVSRIAVSLAATAAIVASMAIGFAADSGDADAALKWREEVKTQKAK